ncbi:conjugal transfer protein TraH, partial [Patescibacteria group bacterium]|nr:conjugal transfer protein TraH [Patescibacteria group bacterium]
MKKRLRPLVNLSTVISLLIAPSSILAVDFATKMLSNTTPARSWEDVASGTTYTSYGSGTYKFARTNNFAPWVEIKGPSAGVSCSGFSFDLGFIGIMNTDEIGDQLGQAGEAFMWGLLTVFKLATPNLSKVFEFINGMIRQIQDLLRNACAMGAKMAQAGAAMTGNPDGFKLMGPIDKAVDLLPVEEMQKLNNKSFLDKYDAAMDKIIESETAENANAIINSFLESSVDRLVKSLGGGGLKFLDVKIKQEAKRFTGKKPLLTHKKLSELFDDGKLKVGEEEVTWAFSSDERILNKAKYLLVSQLLGQVVLKDDISAENKALFHVNEADWKDTLRGLAEKKAGGKPSNISQEMTEQVFTIIPPREINSAEEVVKFLLEGNSDEKIKTDNRYLSVLVFPSSSYGPSIVERKAKFTQYLEETFDNSQIEMEFKGFEDGSRQGIAYLIDKNLPPEKHIN